MADTRAADHFWVCGFSPVDEPVAGMADPEPRVPVREPSWVPEAPAAPDAEVPLVPLVPLVLPVPVPLLPAPIVRGESALVGGT